MENNNITIGSDPEFVIMCGDSVSNALEIFSKVFEEDLSCIEPEEPDYEYIEETYDSSPEIYIERALNNTNIKTLIEEYNPVSATTFIKFFKRFKYTINDILDNTIKEPELLQISKKISEFVKAKGTSEFTRVRTKYNFILVAYIENLDMHKLYKMLNLDQQIIFNELLIDSIAESYNEFNNDFRTIPQIISEYIKDDIIEDWEYDYDRPTDYVKYFCSAEIGCDGYSVTGEMRPRFGNDPIEHFNEILKLIKELQERLEPEIICYDKELQVKAGTVHGPIYEQSLLGGHIHIGYDVKQKVYIAKYLGLMLSIFAGIPLTLIEKPDEIYIRHKTYGKFNDINPKEYGLEFRMPSSWLVSPEITIGALSLTYVVADEFITKYSESKKSSSIDLLFEGTAKYEHIYNKMLYETASDDIDTYYYDALVSMSELLYEEIKTMRLYPEYAEYIDYIFDMIKKYEYWNSDADILTTWSELF